MPAHENKKLVLRAAEDAARNFLHYDREEDDELPEGSLESFISDGIVTIDEIVDQFRATLEEELEDVDDDDYEEDDDDYEEDDDDED